MVDAYREFFSGTPKTRIEVLSRTFEEVNGYDDLVMLRDIRLESHCEHHIAPILGVAHVAYLPRDRVVGISKLARVVEIFAKRLQTQETMTAQIAEAIEQALQPRGVAILIDALHQCMTTRGVHKTDVSTITTRFTGVFKDDADYRDRFLNMVHGRRPAWVDRAQWSPANFPASKKRQARQSGASAGRGKRSDRTGASPMVASGSGAPRARLARPGRAVGVTRKTCSTL